jgi:hypothetical protein
LAQLGDSLDGWRGVAAFYERKRNGDAKAAPRMALYQEIARWVGVKASAVRSWVGLRQLLGDDLIEEFPQYRLSHWRLLRSYARRQPGWMKLDAEHRRAFLGTSAAEYAVSAITPETLAAALNGDVAKPDPFGRALLRMAQAAESARKHADTPEKQTRLEKEIARLGKLE